LPGDVESLANRMSRLTNAGLVAFVLRLPWSIVLSVSVAVGIFFIPYGYNGNHSAPEDPAELKLPG
jgi:hypothetical protein